MTHYFAPSILVGMSFLPARTQTSRSRQCTLLSSAGPTTSRMGYCTHRLCWHLVGLWSEGRVPPPLSVHDRRWCPMPDAHRERLCLNFVPRATLLIIFHTGKGRHNYRPEVNESPGLLCSFRVPRAVLFLSHGYNDPPTLKQLSHLDFEKEHETAL